MTRDGDHRVACSGVFNAEGVMVGQTQEADAVRVCRSGPRRGAVEKLRIQCVDYRRTRRQMYSSTANPARRSTERSLKRSRVSA